MNSCVFFRRIIIDPLHSTIAWFSLYNKTMRVNARSWNPYEKCYFANSLPKTPFTVFAAVLTVVVTAVMTSFVV